MASTAESTSSPRRVIVGVGGGIAAYKTASLVSDLVQSGIDVQVAMTSAAEQFIGAATFSALTGRKVAGKVFEPTDWPLGPHIELADGADCYCIAPATADLIGKLANGIADNLLTTLYLQLDCPVLIAPAMSNQMWAKPAVQRNMDRLREDGVQVIGPEEGWLSCRQKGAGRMSEADDIARRVREILKS